VVGITFTFIFFATTPLIADSLRGKSEFEHFPSKCYLRWPLGVRGHGRRPTGHLLTYRLYTSVLSSNSLQAARHFAVSETVVNWTDDL